MIRLNASSVKLVWFISISLLVGLFTFLRVFFPTFYLTIVTDASNLRLATDATYITPAVISDDVH